MLDTAALLWGLVFGSIGVGYYMYGKRQENLVTRLTGVALMIFPYFVSNNLLLVVVGLALMAVPYFIRL
jgi:hypothetical protein